MEGYQKLRPGQSVWLTPGGNLVRDFQNSLGKFPMEVKVTRVGRKYFYTQQPIYSRADVELRFDIETGKNIGYATNSWWNLWLSKEEYVEHQRQQKQRSLVESVIKNRAPSISVQGIDEICSILIREGLIDPAELEK